MKAKKIICHSSDGTMLDLVVEHELTDVVINYQEKTITPEGDVAFIDKYSDGSYTFGIKQGNHKMYGHTKGYIWSSRASVMNQIFGTDIMEVSVEMPGYVTRICRAFDVDAIRAILPKGWEISKGCYSEGEEYYHIVYVGSKPIKYECCKVMWSADSEEHEELTPTLNLTTILQDV